MEEFDLDVRRAVYTHVVTNGRPPTVGEVAVELEGDEEDVAAAYRRLHDAHALVLFPGSLRVWMANPFCFGPTPHRVTVGGRTWMGTCAWDAVGTSLPRCTRTGSSRRNVRAAESRSCSRS